MKFSNREARREAYRSVFNTPEGQRVFEDLKWFARMDATVFDSDPLRMAFKEGHRAMVLEIEKIMSENYIKEKNNG